jgi:hypothetical protein
MKREANWLDCELEEIKPSLDSAGNPFLLGERSFGRVYSGRAKFVDTRGIRHNNRVVIKVFKNPHLVSSVEANRYSQIIRDFWEHGVTIPKTIMHQVTVEEAKHFEALLHPKYGGPLIKPGHWIQIMQLFGSNKASTLRHTNFDYSARQKEGMIRNAVRMANAGYPIRSADLFLEHITSKGMIPGDLDSPVFCVQKVGREKSHELAEAVRERINSLTKTGKEHAKLLAIAREEADPFLREKI